MKTFRNAMLITIFFSFMIAGIATSRPQDVAAQAPGDWVGWPSADETDGKFLDISGPLFQVEYVPYIFFIGIPGDATSFDIEIFDGDADFLLSGHYDVMFTTSQFTYNLYQDPLKDGSGMTIAATQSSTAFTDNAWAPMVTSQAVGAGAQAASGHYFYRLEFTFDDDPDAEPFLNGFKVRARSNSPTMKAQLSAFQEVTVVGAPINVNNDPAMGTAGNSYDGDWHYYVDVPVPQPSVRFTDGDADYRLDADTIPSPADDSTDALVRVSPDIQYQIFSPSSTLITTNMDPSGNLETETFTYAPSPGPAESGFYDWHWIGADAGNTTYINTDFEMFTEPVVPFPVQAVDYGDLPSAYNNTLLSDNGARHTVGSLFLGAAIDAETDGQESGDASGDGSDDDGLVRDSADLWTPGATVNIDATIAGGTGRLAGWFDWNGDGDFDDGGEFVDFGSVSGTPSLNLTIPGYYRTSNPVTARFRLFDPANLPGGSLDAGDFVGSASNGEVEDYVWNFGPTAVTLQNIQANTSSPLLIASMIGFLMLALVSFGTYRFRTVTISRK